jgi:hypothetical protein
MHSRNTQLIPPPVNAPAKAESNTLSFLTLDIAVFSSCIPRFKSEFVFNSELESMALWVWVR